MSVQLRAFRIRTRVNASSVFESHFSVAHRWWTAWICFARTL